MKDAVKWRFFRAGGVDQVRLASGNDLKHLNQLDQKLWVALACPTSGMELDTRTLELIDANRDGRVRAPELIAAVQFACRYLKNPDDLLKREASLKLSAIDDSSDEGKTLLSAAKQVLTNLGKQGDGAILADDLANPAKIFENTAFNGDGIITELSVEDEFQKGVLRDVIECLGSVVDRSGKPGISAEKLDTFFEVLGAHAAWQAQAHTDPSILPLDRQKTSLAAEATAAIRTKVDDYFARCRLAAFEPRLGQLLNRKEEEYQEVLRHDLSPSASEVAGFPLAPVGPNKSLGLLAQVNPAHAAASRRLYELAVTPLLGPAKTTLSEEDWSTLTQLLTPYETWLANRQGTRVEKLGLARVQAILDSGAQSGLRDLIAKDEALKAEAESLENVERLVRYHRDLFLLCTNFVNFEHFYDEHKEPAVFQCGTLYLDQRSCGLCIRVTDPAKHATMAGLSGAYLAYLDCSRPASAETMQIVAAITNGDSDNLMVGRNGLFYDRSGRDWDATVTKIVDNPISLRQAFWSPYKKLVRMIETQVAKRAASAEGESSANLNSLAESAVNAEKSAASGKKIDVGSVAALGVAVGALGVFFTAVVGYATGILKMGPLATIGAVFGVILLISTPSVVLAYITLRKRNLGPILDASGWAINAHARINVNFGASLTSLAKLPPGSRREARDPYADQGFPWFRVVVALLLILLVYYWFNGSLDRFLPDRFDSVRVLGHAPRK